MKALVTGGLGFIGSYLSESLMKEGWEIRIIDNEDKMRPNPKIEYIIGDIVDEPTVRKAIEGINLVVHLAAKHRFFGVSKEEFYRVNVEGTRNILKVASEQSMRDIIFYSSVSIYGDQDSAADENMAPKPNSLYGITKRDAEQLIENWILENERRNALIIRPTVVYGPRSRGNVYRLIRQISKRLFIPIGRGENIKSMAYVENLVAATIFLMDKGFHGVEIYNYSDEPHLSFKEIVALIYQIMERSAPSLHLPIRPVLLSFLPFDMASKITGGSGFVLTKAVEKMNKTTHYASHKIRQLGFRQECPVEEGLKRTIEWYQSLKREERRAEGREE